MPYRPASHSPDLRNQIQAGAPPVQQQTPQPDPYQPVHHRPQSTYDHPQELGTSVYDSPVDHPAPAQRLPYTQSGQAPPTQQFQPQGYSPSGYPIEDTAQAPPASTLPQVPHQFQQQPQQPPYPNSPASQQPAPSHQPPPVPGASQQPQYTSYTPPAPAPAGDYQAYQPSQGGAAGSNPASFYQ
jgi:signal transducing adaptor molecule